MIPYPRKVDYSLYNLDGEDLSTKFGLPSKVQFCSQCVISNQRPNSAVEFKQNIKTKKATIKFDESGVCDGCIVAREKKNIDWEERQRELMDLCDQHRRSDGRYDCIVPGSGGKDSFYTSHILKYKFHMNPLTVTWAPHIYTKWGWENFQRWIHAGFDNQLFTPNGKIHRLLTRLACETIFHPFQPFALGQKNLGPKMSALMEIPLVFYGENEAEYGNPRGDTVKPVRDWRFFSADDKRDLYIGGILLDELREDYGLSDNDLEPYMPADPSSLQKTGTQVHYLGYYLKWHPQGCYYFAQENGGFEPSPERTVGTYSKYNSIDDKVDDLHFFTYHAKFGIGRATYDAAQEVRSGDITREEAIALVRRYDGEFPERFIDEILNFISLPLSDFPIASKMFEQPIVDRAYFNALTDQNRSPHLWKYEDNSWKLRYAVWLE